MMNISIGQIWLNKKTTWVYSSSLTPQEGSERQYDSICDIHKLKCLGLKFEWWNQLYFCEKKTIK